MHPVRRRLISAAAALTLGIISSLPFYRVSSQHDSIASSPKTEPPTATPSSVTGLHTHGQESGEAVAVSDGPKQNTPAPRIGTAKPGNVESERTLLVPKLQLPNQHPAAQETVPPATSIRRVVQDSFPKNTDDSSSESESKKPRLHWIVDGDTLEDLAQRFLGDGSRWREIRDANREVLTADDILPIGKEIRIPARDGVKSREGVKSPPVDPPAGAKEGLDPIPWNKQ